MHIGTPQLICVPMRRKKLGSKMSKSKINIVGIGCDFQSESDDNSRKLAIESLTGGENERIK